MMTDLRCTACNHETADPHQRGEVWVCGTCFKTWATSADTSETAPVSRADMERLSTEDILYLRRHRGAVSR